jgi:hypothetical protein
LGGGCVREGGSVGELDSLRMGVVFDAGGMEG